MTAPDPAAFATEAAYLQALRDYANYLKGYAARVVEEALKLLEEK